MHNQLNFYTVISILLDQAIYSFLVTSVMRSNDMRSLYFKYKIQSWILYFVFKYIFESNFYLM